MLIKICGVKNREAIEAAVSSGATAVGFNFHPLSSRYIAPELAVQLRTWVPNTVRTIGVFVRPVIQEAMSVAPQVSLDVIQLHGMDDESLQAWRGSHWPLWIAKQIETTEDIHKVHESIQSWKANQLPVEAVLLDAKVPGEHGGTGRVLPWELLRGERFDLPVILAGGLRHENVAAAMAMVKPQGVDVASGVESGPGVKDPALIRRFVQAAKLPVNWLLLDSET